MPKINYNIPATSYCHGGSRALSAIKYIVIHYTAVNGDTAKNEATYFSRNYSRYAGAHFFVDQSGYIAQSINMNVTAWAVGGSKYSGTNPQYYGSCTNYNSVSIEMCDQVNKDASAKQIEAVRWLISYIKQSCPNAKTIIRHYDVNGKPCPARYLNASKWNSLKSAVTATGWNKIGNTWYYFKSNGAMATGWLKDGGKWYYLKSDGSMAIGWQKISGEWYYFDGSGAMKTGWQKDSKGWCYLLSSGKAAKSKWISWSGNWYYLKSDYRMAVNQWQKDSKGWCYLLSDGRAAKNQWISWSGKWYYLKSDCRMVTGWQTIGGKKYYFYSSGAMATGTITIDGKKYTFSDNGALIEK